ncbi:MAG TPA: hypothetical protein VER33_18780, partial [Polyangiaceae bacterium]|nr:hypothetical protein [Polyangiaceae bacterium]
AYQMNWKGENFYTGNHIPAFVTSGPRFKQWLEQQRARGTRVIFATTEHSRTTSLRKEVGKVKSFRVITDEALNNKFTLTRIEL